MMEKFIESILYHFVKIVGILVRLLPSSVALGLGSMVGCLIYYFDIKHRSLAYGNLKIAFSKSKTPNEIKRINKQIFRNFGRNLIELLRLPLMNAAKFKECVHLQGKEHIDEALKKKKGVILLAMHFGSWELASLSCAMFEHPYKVIVKPQKKFERLNELLNSYRSCGGNIVLSRGLGTRELVKSLRNNEVIGMVVDQGGRDGALIPFFDRQASMSVGAIRMALKLDIPICFSIIIREKGSSHKMIVHKPMDLINTGDVDHDIVSNLNQIAKIMEHYIEKHPAEYMWFYKIWKYSKESNIVILSDGKTGHLRQSQRVALSIEKALSERDIKSQTKVIRVSFKNKFSARLISGLSLLVNSFVFQGRLESLKWVLTDESFNELMSVKADFIVSCGSSIAGVNWLLSTDQNAKSIVVLKPGLLSFRRFDLVVAPKHDNPPTNIKKTRVVVTKGAPNIIEKEYLEEQKKLLCHRYSHLKFSQRVKIGLLIGGDTKNQILNEKDVKFVVNQIKEVAAQINADIFATTSRRTSARIENLLMRELKPSKQCQLLILPSRDDVPEAFGGILGLSDILIVSGDSISMVSEAASSGKKTIVFPLQYKAKVLKKQTKHSLFVENLNSQGYVVSTNVRNIGRTIYDVVREKIQTQKLDDSKAILKAVRHII